MKRFFILLFGVFIPFIAWSQLIVESDCDQVEIVGGLPTYDTNIYHVDDVQSWIYPKRNGLGKLARSRCG
jgi:hypothetical protein